MLVLGSACFPERLALGFHLTRWLQTGTYGDTQSFKYKLFKSHQSQGASITVACVTVLLVQN